MGTMGQHMGHITSQCAECVSQPRVQLEIIKPNVSVEEKHQVEKEFVEQHHLVCATVYHDPDLSLHFKQYYCARCVPRFLNLPSDWYYHISYRSFVPSENHEHKQQTIGSTSQTFSLGSTVAPVLANVFEGSDTVVLEPGDMTNDSDLHETPELVESKVTITEFHDDSSLVFVECSK